jgi:hypothetical protein
MIVDGHYRRATLRALSLAKPSRPGGRRRRLTIWRSRLLLHELGPEQRSEPVKSTLVGRVWGGRRCAGPRGRPAAEYDANSARHQVLTEIARFSPAPLFFCSSDCPDSRPALQGARLRHAYNPRPLLRRVVLLRDRRHVASSAEALRRVVAGALPSCGSGSGPGPIARTTVGVTHHLDMDFITRTKGTRCLGDRDLKSRLLRNVTHARLSIARHQPLIALRRYLVGHLCHNRHPVVVRHPSQNAGAALEFRQPQQLRKSPRSSERAKKKPRTSEGLGGGAEEARLGLGGDK